MLLRSELGGYEGPCSALLNRYEVIDGGYYTLGLCFVYLFGPTTLGFLTYLTRACDGALWSEFNWCKRVW